MRILKSLALALLTVGAATVHAAPTIPLVDGQPRTFNLSARSFTNSFFIDVPASSQRLTVQLSADAADLDLLLSSANPFPDQIGGQAPNVTQLFDAAQYKSTSLASVETLAISRSNVFPVAAGRWYLSIINQSATTAAAGTTLTALLSDAPPAAIPIEVVFDDASNGCGIAEWNNATARTPINGNNGTTLGAQRQNAVREAARLVGIDIKSDVPVRVQACWKNLGTGSAVTLAQAGPTDVFTDETWLPRSNTYYAIAAASKLGGARGCGLTSSNCRSAYDVEVTFNDQVDTANVATDFYYGFGGTAPQGTSDFIATTMHELAHGLGFLSFINLDSAQGPVGQKPDGLDDAYGHNLVGVNTTDNSLTRFMAMTDGQRAAAITGSDQLRWDDPRAVTSNDNVAQSLPVPDNFIFMHTPPAILTGSSLSHLGVRDNGELMQATVSRSQRSLMLGGPMLEAVGWSTTPQGGVAPSLPASNNLFDAQRNGHGIDFVRVRGNIYALTFYTYDAIGEPEWFQAVGSVTNGVFVPVADAAGKTLIRYRYNIANSPPQQAVSSLSGTVSLDFNNPANQAPCNDGRPSVNATAVMTFSIGADPALRWCMEPIVAANARPATSFSGLWFAGSQDDGWGWSILNFSVGQVSSTYGLLFYYDANGNPAWSFSLYSGVSPNSPNPIIHRRAFCRTCTTSAFVDRVAGSVTFGFTQPSESASVNNRVTYHSTPQNTAAGRFARTNSPFVLLTTPQ